MRAQDLLKMYAERQALTRPRCVPDDASYAEFERGFIYEPTPDQLTCFEAIRPFLRGSPWTANAQIWWTSLAAWTRV